MPLELVRDWVQEYHPSALLRSPDEREFLPAALEIIERPASPAGRLVAMCICAAALFALIWATFGKIDIIATAHGRVIPVGDTKVIQPVEIGTVQAIRVADGDTVKKGQILIELDPTQTEADRDRYHEELRRAELNLAELQGLWVAIQNHTRPVLASTPSDASAQEIAAAHAEMESRYDEQTAGIADLAQQIVEKADEVSAAANSIAKYKATLPYIQQQADLRGELMKLQFSNKLAYLQAQQALVEQQRQIVVLANERDEASAQKLSLQQKRDEAVETYEKTVLDDLTKTQAQVADLRAGEIKSSEEFADKTLRAPISGTVQQLAVHTIGGVVTPAQSLMLIVPKSGGLVVEARVDNRDIGFVHAGQLAQIKVDTFNFTRYGLIHGVVTSLSHDAVAPDTANSSKEKNSSEGAAGNSDASDPAASEPSYVAYVKLDRSWMDTETGRDALEPGMIVTTEIQTGRRRVIDYLLSPLQRGISESMHER
jgi:hemolysin D